MKATLVRFTLVTSLLLSVAVVLGLGLGSFLGTAEAAEPSDNPKATTQCPTGGSLEDNVLAILKRLDMQPEGTLGPRQRQVVERALYAYIEVYDRLVARAHKLPIEPEQLAKLTTRLLDVFCEGLDSLIENIDR